jgi:hypothetical protein
MKDSDDPLDLLEDDGDGVVEMSLFEEEEKGSKCGGNKSGCSIVFLLSSSSLVIAGWYVSQWV